MNVLDNNQKDILKKLYKFYSNETHLNRMLPIVQQKTNISLRLIEHFVINYCKNNNISYEIDDKLFNVYLEYKSQLKAYLKKNFDPCRRNTRILFNYEYKEEKKQLETTIGQLNFFRWFIHYKVLDYLIDNLKEIESDMKGLSKKIQKNKEKIKNHEKVVNDGKKNISTSGMVNSNNIKVIVTFH